MPRAKDMNVDVIAIKDPASPHGVRFELGHGQPNPQRVGFDNDGHPGVMVYFNLKDRSRTGLEFKPTPSSALWVNSHGPVCPPGSCAWNGFLPLSVEKKGKKQKHKQLIVYCRNEEKKEFGFTLWFRRPAVGGGWEDVDYDPIGDGNNGLRL